MLDVYRLHYWWRYPIWRDEEEWHVTRYDGYVAIAFPLLRSSLTYFFLLVLDVITLTLNLTLVNRVNCTS